MLKVVLCETLDIFPSIEQFSMCIRYIETIGQNSILVNFNSSNNKKIN